MSQIFELMRNISAEEWSHGYFSISSSIPGELETEPAHKRLELLLRNEGLYTFLYADLRCIDPIVGAFSLLIYSDEERTDQIAEGVYGKRDLLGKLVVDTKFSDPRFEPIVEVTMKLFVVIIDFFEAQTNEGITFGLRCWHAEGLNQSLNGTLFEVQKAIDRTLG